MSGQFIELFQRIRAMFQRFEAQALKCEDGPGRYFLATHEVRSRDGYRTAFGGVEIRKRYVSVHLMPVYVHPELLAEVSEQLRRRMQGKSCFNFTTVDESLLDQLRELIEAGAALFESQGRLESPGPSGRHSSS